MAIDYRSLLSRYIHHVLDNEGVDFIDGCFTKENDDDNAREARKSGSSAFPIFTEEEISELNKLGQWPSLI